MSMYMFDIPKLKRDCALKTKSNEGKRENVP